MNSHKELINYLISNGILKTENIINAFKKIDRKDFIPPEYIFDSYQDIPLSIGYGQTISQPSTVAFMLELLGVESGNKVLDIGSGSGWTTALLSMMVGESGKVDGYELIPKLVEFGKNNIEKYHLKNASISLSKENFSFIKGKYDKILVSAGTNNIPKDLVEKLKIGGIIVIPINDYLYKVIKLNNKLDFDILKYYGFIFVPLITE